jgi:hypothetical protein
MMSYVFLYTFVLGNVIIQTLSGGFQKLFPYCITIKEWYPEDGLITGE